MTEVFVEVDRNAESSMLFRIGKQTTNICEREEEADRKFSSFRLLGLDLPKENQHEDPSTYGQGCTMGCLLHKVFMCLAEHVQRAESLHHIIINTW